MKLNKEKSIVITVSKESTAEELKEYGKPFPSNNVKEINWELLLSNLYLDIECKEFKKIPGLFGNNGIYVLESICKYYNLKIDYTKMKETKERFDFNRNDIFISKACSVQLDNIDGKLQAEIYIDEDLSEFNKRYALAHAISYYFIFMKLKDKDYYIQPVYYNNYLRNYSFVFRDTQRFSSKIEFFIETFAIMLLAPFFIFKEYDDKLHEYQELMYKEPYKNSIPDIDEYIEQLITKLCKKYKISKHLFYKAMYIHRSLNDLNIICH